MKNYRIRIFHEHATNEWHVGWKFTAQIDRLKKRESVPLTSRVIIGPECGGHVHDTRSFLRRHKALADNYFVLSAFLVVLHPVKRSLVALSDELVAAEGPNHLPARGEVVTENRRSPCQSEDHSFGGVSFLFPQLDVFERGINRQCDVGDECPGRSGPDEDATSGLA